VYYVLHSGSYKYSTRLEVFFKTNTNSCRRPFVDELESKLECMFLTYNLTIE
jgi:hypothetical protein